MPKVYLHANPTETEARAAADIQPHVERLIDQVHRVIVNSGPHGATGSEIADAIGAWVYSVKPRLTELSQMGAVVVAGQRPNPRGRMEQVFIATRFRKETPNG